MRVPPQDYVDEPGVITVSGFPWRIVYAIVAAFAVLGVVLIYLGSQEAGLDAEHKAVQDCAHGVVN